MRSSARLFFALVACGLNFAIPLTALATTAPSGDCSVGHASIELAYDEATGNLVYVLTPDRLAPLGDNPINGVDQNAAAPLYIVVYPPGAEGIFNCMGVPGNCEDHDAAIAGIATWQMSGTYGTDPTAVPGHDHLVGVAATGGDVNTLRLVYVELFTSKAAITHITTLAQLQAAWASDAIDPTASGQGVDTGITFVSAVVSSATYQAGKPVS